MFTLTLVAWIAVTVAPLVAPTWRGYRLVALVILAPLFLLPAYFYVVGPEQRLSAEAGVAFVMVGGAAFISCLARAGGLFLQGREWSRVGALGVEVLAIFALMVSYLSFFLGAQW